MSDPRRIIRIEGGVSLPQAILDYFAGKWIEIFTAFVAGGGMTYLATITNWLAPWGPVAWGGIGLISAVFVFLASEVYLAAKSKRLADDARAELDKILSQVRQLINPLARQFDKIIINPNDLFIVYDPIHEGKTFTGCDFIGPALIVFLDRCEILSPRMYACNFIVFDDRKPAHLQGSVGFKSTRFENCRFVNITFLIPAGMAELVRSSAAPGSGFPDFIGFDPTASAANSPSTAATPDAPAPD